MGRYNCLVGALQLYRYINEAKGTTERVTTVYRYVHWSQQSAAALSVLEAMAMHLGLCGMGGCDQQHGC